MSFMVFFFFLFINGSLIKNLYRYTYRRDFKNFRKEKKKF